MNVHDAVFPGGEIRGQIVAATAPEPASLGLLALGMLLMLVCAPRMRRLHAAS
jgi:PEP-CTERM motif